MTATLPTSNQYASHAPNRPRLLTGDTPTGRLHLGHWVGSVEERIKLQNQYDCYFIIANIQALTTHYDQPNVVRQQVLAVLADYLAAGIDPKQSTIFLQSEIPAIAELTLFFSMLVPYNQLMRNPTIKEEIRAKGLGDHYSVGFLLYPIHQIADILAFRPVIVPVGADQLPHLEITRALARRFNQLYCDVDPQIVDADQVTAGGLFPIPVAKVGQVKRLIGIGPPDKNGQLLKMSKSLNNAIFLSDDAETIKQKIMSLYTDPHRLKATDKGTINNNPLWIFHDIFNPDKRWVNEAKARYQEGKIGDVACKKKLIDCLVAFIEPIRQRRLAYEKDSPYLLSILREGTQKANTIAQETLQLIKDRLKQQYF